MKEPQLLAEIRTNKARAEKAAKAQRASEPQGPILAGTVETLAVPNPPSNYITQTLDECTTVEQCEELLAHAEQHGYDRNGQTVKLIREKINALGSDNAKLPAKARKRGRR